MDFLETPLLTLSDDPWKNELPTPTKEILQWENAQAVSLGILQKHSQLTDYVYTLSKLSDKDNLEKLWRTINLVRNVCLLAAHRFSDVLHKSYLQRLPAHRWMSCGGS